MLVSSSRAAFHLMAKPSSFHCNIQCEYCFYLSKSQNFGEKAPMMSLETLKNYVKNYIESNPSNQIDFMWQGGEPTLLGLDFYQQVVFFQQQFANGKKITNAFQTNGIALNHQWAAFFKQHQFLIGISIDGMATIHNRYRISNNGQPTFDKVLKAVELLKYYAVEFNTLTVVNDQNWQKGRETYLALKELGSTFMQFIPIVEWHKSTDNTPQLSHFSVPQQGYGYFLFSVFEEWIKNDLGQIFVIEFDNLLGQWLGYPSSNCVYQPTCGKSLVTEANGDVYSCDHFVYPEYKLGNLNHQSLAEITQSDKQIHFGQHKQQLTTVCQQCEFKTLCYGGCLKHRIITMANEENQHNYLCASYRYFFDKTRPYMQKMSTVIRQGQRPALRTKTSILVEKKYENSKTENHSVSTRIITLSI